MPNNEQQSSHVATDVPAPAWIEQLVAAAEARVVGDPPDVRVLILRHVVSVGASRYKVVGRLVGFDPASVRHALTNTPGASGIALDFPTGPGVRLVSRGAAIERAILPARR